MKVSAVEPEDPGLPLAGQKSVSKMSKMSKQNSRGGSLKGGQSVPMQVMPSMAFPSANGKVRNDDPNLPQERMTGGERRAVTIRGSLASLPTVPEEERSRKRRMARCCRNIVESAVATAITTVLTLWVLVCDDLRILVARQPDDNIFEYILIVSLIVFGMEIILAAVGKEDYFMGFLFIMDVISTSSLVLDLPSVQEAMAQDDGGLRGSSEGKTARIGAKAARVVRIVRLVRIVKLYKIFIDYFEEKIDAWMGVRPGDESHQLLEDVDRDNTDEEKGESLVGKHLSHATLKRVIILILAMLTVVPSLSAEESLKYPLSPDYGADEVAATFAAKLDSVVTEEFYEKSLFRYIYYHNWYSGKMTDDGNCPRDSSVCPKDYFNHLFWVGISGKDRESVESKRNEARLNQVTASERMREWGVYVSEQDDLYNFGSMPSFATDAIKSDWTTDCSRTLSDGTTEFTLGFSLLNSDGEPVNYAVVCPHKELRATEYEWYLPRLVSANQDDKASNFVFFFDKRGFQQTQAIYGIAVTVYVCFSLVIAIMFFTRDANQLVLRPVESMIAKVEKIRENPMAAVRMGDQEFRNEENERIKKKKPTARFKNTLSMSSVFGTKAVSEKKQPMETLILEKTLVKLGSLLALGFGEAGANIINKNMQSGDTADVDVMIKGELVQCIYGQARIQDFSVITEVLQSKVMQFVNQIAEIVHGVVVEYLGAANKNTGDTFLLVWRSTRPDGEDLTKLADMSISAFCKIIASLNHSNALATYPKHPRLQFLLGSRYRVALNIGVHGGWAFEGAMGSEYKIDASYISPNLAITANVEAATQHFRVPLLVTEDVVMKCSPGVAEVCRKIDTVYIAGKKDAMDLHVVDLNPLAIKEDGPRKPLAWNPRERYKVRQFLEAERNRNRTDDAMSVAYLHNNASMRAMRRDFTVEFLQTFKMGFKNYIEGEWQVSQGLLVKACNILGFRDGPSESLLEFMQRHKFNAPKDWRGFRDLGPLLQLGPARENEWEASRSGSKGLRPKLDGGKRDSYDLMARPCEGEGGVPDKTAVWQLPNEVPKDNLPLEEGSLRGTADPFRKSPNDPFRNG
jgi:class 3 adenylate cyclase